MTTKCCLCKELATTGVRGQFEKGYIYFCSVHAGAMQMIFELVSVGDHVRWKPLYEKPIKDGN